MAVLSLSLIHIPKEVLIYCILPFLDQFTLAKLSQTCTPLGYAVTNYLTVTRTLDMSLIFTRIMNRGSKMGTADVRKGAFMFLTKNATITGLRKFVFSNKGPAGPSVAHFVVSLSV